MLFCKGIEVSMGTLIMLLSFSKCAGLKETKESQLVVSRVHEDEVNK